MDETVYLELLAEDKRSIAYRPRFASLTNSALSAILLQQIIYWWKIKEKQPFFKFREPSNHNSYKPDDSWCEELCWNAYEFDTALKVIATKITKGVKKSDVLGGDVPIRKDDESDQDFYIRLEAALKRCVLYWTDSHRVTWYQVNEQILGKFVNRIYLDKFYGLRNLKYSILSDTRKNRKVKDTSVSETTPETTTEITTKEIAANAAPLSIVKPTSKKKERKPSPAQPLHDALIAAFGFDLATMTSTADKSYWMCAAELHKVQFPADDIPGLYGYVKSRAQREGWSSFSVMSLSKYLPDYLKSKSTPAPSPNYIPDETPEQVAAKPDMTADDLAIIEKLAAKFSGKATA